jgi:hypothetical protein
MWPIEARTPRQGLAAYLRTHTDAQLEKGIAKLRELIATQPDLRWPADEAERLAAVRALIDASD